MLCVVINLFYYYYYYCHNDIYSTLFTNRPLYLSLTHTRSLAPSFMDLLGEESVNVGNYLARVLRLVRLELGGLHVCDSTWNGVQIRVQQISQI